MSVLILDAKARSAIAKVIELARDQAVPLDATMRAAIDDRAKPTAMLSLAERKSEITIPPRSQHLQLGSYRCAISFEHQPAGLIRHLSVSVSRPGKVPNEIAMAEIAKAYGFSGFPPEQGRIWLEEFEPGHHAVNVIEVEAKQP